MKVCYVSTFFPPTVQTPDAMLKAWPLLRYLPAALADEGHDVVVLAHAGQQATMMLDSVRYEFVDPGIVAKQAARLLNRWKPRHGPAYYIPASRLVRRLYHERPDLVHFSGLTLDLHLALVSRACARLRIPLVAHYHGGVPDQGRMSRVQAANATRINRVLVTTFEQAEPWVAAGLFERSAFAQVVETSSPFRALDRDIARARTSMRGDPIYLSAGRLDEIKDPLTMLRGFENIVASQPTARLYMYYLSGDMLGEIDAFLNARPMLRERVELRGTAPPENMQAIYSSADFLLQASLREWSGLAVLEAMSCGCIPIVTDIPSFRTLTDGGRFGKLFTIGDADGLARCALEITPLERTDLAIGCREHFERHLSFSAMAVQISEVYDEVCNLDDTSRIGQLADSECV